MPAGESTASAHVSPLRVLFCTDNFGVGGTELNAVRTAEALVRRGVELEVAALQADGPLRSRYDAAGIPVHSFPLANLYGPGALRQGIRFARLVRRGGFDVVHCHDIYSNIFAGFWARVGRSPAVVSSRRWGATASARRLTALDRLFARRATAVLTNSQEAAHRLRTTDRVSDRRVHYLPNFVDDVAFETPSEAELLERRESLQLPLHQPLVGIVARLEPVKDHATLLQAVAIVRSHGLDVHLAIVGDGSQRASLQERTARLGLASSVTFTGSLPHRPPVAPLFDIAVLTSLSEGFPNAVVEAMAAGRPVVATAVGGVQDAVTHDETGLLVPPQDEVALASALERLIRDPQLARRLGSRGQKFAAERFREEAVIRRLEQLYAELSS